ncbi:sn-glycerol-3-phosphate ABC transporter ATP-binding protein UgpC [Pseudenhygromyxa sp. WMMC2535]|uniref:ABC transporter ATP-binding protein n=1 Tax=Pseudenhygromyxa sp. WMMC2535 TaxID=2712867 RepID=UPI0015516E9E|nr:sn-glycerol-3-phosphate ABC transporter ATP-binding protein UgpC [Pseudenhygromyxa sp. WMMC2535]NVB37680.1 sn-glycerol-3-phosphate ABC transporter ATP-binding protein UgpC [Pseudenhygromyxa sp. WMMC2535]
MVSVRGKQIVKRFGETTVLRGIDLDIAAGQFAVLVGPSGCGKSTLLRLLAGLERVSSGTIHFGEREVTELEPRERDIAMVFQSYALYPHMSVRKNLEFGLRLRKTDAATITTRVEEVARMLDIHHLLDRLPRALSGGQRQRVAMGRAIVRRPALFLFDEPLSNLDPALRTQVRVDIRKQHDELEATSIYVTHDQVEAMTLADVLFVLEGGEVQQRGAPIDIYRAPVNCFVAKFLGSPAMNLVPTTLHRAGSSWRAGAVEIREPGPFSGLAEDKAVILGLRPHDLELAPAGEGELTLEVEVVETLGPELTIHGVLTGDAERRPFIAALPAEHRVARGDTLPLRVERLHLFDAETERSLR